MDFLTRERQARGLPAVSVQWGAWAGAGMAVQLKVVDQLEQQGISPVMEEQGVCALELAMSNAASHRRLNNDAP